MVFILAVLVFILAIFAYDGAQRKKEAVDLFNKVRQGQWETWDFESSQRKQELLEKEKTLLKNYQEKEENLARILAENEQNLRSEARRATDGYIKNLEDYKIEYEKIVQEQTGEMELEMAQWLEDAILVEEALNELAQRRSLAVANLKKEAEDKDKKNFYKLQIGSDDLEDIEQLRQVEKLIHNKDVLRKLIYKSYIEHPLNELMARVGVSSQPGIYKIENAKDGRVYIGQSVNVKNRWRDHVKSAIGISSIAEQAVHVAMREEGLENFSFDLIDDCEREMLNEREKYWIEFYKSGEWGYNRTRGG